MATSPTTTFQGIDNSVGSFFITDAVGTIVYANKAMEERSGYDVPELIGERPGELWGGMMPRKFYGKMWKTIRDRQDPLVASMTNRKKSGEVKKETIQVAPIADSNGELKFFVEVHPSTNSKKDTRQFHKEFHRVFSHPQPLANDVVDWMADWLHADVGLGYTNASTRFIDVITSDFVNPTKERFKDRYSDKALVEAAQYDPELFAHIYHKYHRDISYYFQTRLSGDKWLQQELTQDVFLRSFQYLPSYQPKNASYRTYLLRVAHSVLVNYFRKKQEINLEDVAEPSKSYKDSYDAGLVLEQLLYEDIGLSEMERQTLQMKYQQGYSVHEIATILDKTENAVKLLLSRGRKKLRKFQ